MLSSEICIPVPVVEASPLTDREVGVIANADFFGPYENELHDLFVALDREDRWTDDQEALCSYMEQAWLGGEHGNSPDKDQFRPAQEQAGWRVIAAVGFTRRILPEAGVTVDAAVMIGATDPTNQVTAREFRYVREVLGIQVPSLCVFTGENRARMGADGSVMEIVDRLLQNGGMPQPGSRWLQEQLALARGEKVGLPFKNELALARLCLGTLVNGGHELEPTRIGMALTDLNNPHARLPESLEYTLRGETRRLPARVMMDRHFVAADGMDVTLMNGAAVPREQGIPRHTSRSCFQEHIDRYPVPKNGRLLLVGAQPYGVRIAQEFRDELDTAGRSDVRLDVALAPLRPDMPIQSALGNFASLTRWDIRRKQKMKG